MIPEHYSADGVDPLAVLPSLYTLNNIESPIVGFLYGNALKYLWRFNAKGQPNSDLLKCIDYIEHIVKRMNELEMG